MTDFVAQSHKRSARQANPLAEPRGEFVAQSHNVSEPPDPDIPQDPGIPGVDTISDAGDTPTPDEKDERAQEREHTETDDEGQMTPPREG